LKQVKRSEGKKMSAAKSRPPMPSTNEASSVRERSPSAPPAASPSAPPVSASAGATRERLEAKLRTARTLLGTLPATDDRARLLHIAIQRRDESLLDGVLASLNLSAKSAPPRR
jgi:hypothetical protein